MLTPPHTSSVIDQSNITMLQKQQKGGQWRKENNPHDYIISMWALSHFSVLYHPPEAFFPPVHFFFHSYNQNVVTIFRPILGKCFIRFPHCYVILWIVFKAAQYFLQARVCGMFCRHKVHTQLLEVASDCRSLPSLPEDCLQGLFNPGADFEFSPKPDPLLCQLCLLPIPSHPCLCPPVPRLPHGKLTFCKPFLCKKSNIWVFQGFGSSFFCFTPLWMNRLWGWCPCHISSSGSALGVGRARKRRRSDLYNSEHTYTPLAVVGQRGSGGAC